MLQVGDKVRIVKGMFYNLTGTIEEIERNRAYVLFNCYYTKEHYEEKYHDFALTSLEKINN